MAAHHRGRVRFHNFRLLLCIAASLPLASSGRSWRQMRRREEEGGQVAFAIAGAVSAYTGTAQLYTTWQPGGMAYRPIRRRLLSENQRIAASLAAAAAGISAARWLADNAEAGSRIVRVAGKVPVALADRVTDAWWSMQAKRAETERLRKEAKRKAWLRDNTRKAVVYRRDH